MGSTKYRFFEVSVDGQRYKDKIDSGLNPPTLIALATHSRDKDPTIELYGRYIDYSL